MSKHHVTLSYVHPITVRHMKAELASVEAALLTVKALRALYRRNYRITLKGGYFTYSFFSEAEGWITASA